MFKSESDSAAYFQHSANMRNDIRVRAVRRKFGNEGYAVMNYLFELMTEKPEFKLEFSPIDRELLAADFDVETEWLGDFVEYCEEVQLFNLNLDENTLSSEFLKDIFKPLFELRQKRSERQRENVMKRWNAKNTTVNDGIPRYTTVNDGIPRNTVEKSRVEKSIGEERIGEDTELIKEDNKEDNSLEAKASTSSEKTDDAQGESFNKKGFIEFFNKTMEEAGASIPRIESIQGRREAAIKARISEFGKAKVMRAIEIAAKSQFLNGGGDKAFIASCDWIMRPNNFPKVVEGNYNTINNHANGDSDQGHNRRRGVETTATCAEDYRNSSF